MTTEEKIDRQSQRENIEGKIRGILNRSGLSVHEMIGVMAVVNYELLDLIHSARKKGNP